MQTVIETLLIFAISTALITYLYYCNYLENHYNLLFDPTTLEHVASTFKYYTIA